MSPSPSDAAGHPQDTPVIRQYLDIKKAHPHAVLFFRMGDFYEMFFDDAVLASRELGLTLTSRNNGGAANVPLAGVPVKAAADYVKRLVDRGHRVAICEQVEDPKLAKGIVRRAVVETITPGAMLSEHLLESSRNNFLVALLSSGGRLGMSAIDVSTGEFILEILRPSDLDAALVRYSPREVVVAEDDPCLQSLPAGVMSTVRDPWEYDAALATEDLTRRFGLTSLAGLGIEPDDTAAVAAAGALLRYACELQPGGLPHLSRPVLRRSDGVMPLDMMTRRNLELVEQMRPDGAAPTVLALLDQTLTPMGARLLRTWLLAPLTDLAAIEARHDAVDVLHRDGRGRARLREALDGVRDIERLAGRVASRRASPRDLGALRDSLHRLPDVLSALQGVQGREGSKKLDVWTDALDLHSGVCAQLQQTLVDRPPMSLGDQDTVRAGADADVDETRTLRDGSKQFIAELQARERDATGIPSLKVGFNRVFGYYIEITKTHRNAVPPSYERRQTLTNAERYVTPELKEYEARVLSAEDRILDLERAIVEELCRVVHERLTRLQGTAAILARLDVVASFAEVSAAADYVRPVMTDGFELELVACRHAVVERMLPHGKFIPNDVRLDQASRVMLLTGPNMAGKSTILRQVGLCVLLAQIGAFVPARAARIGVVDRVFTRVGASDNLGGGQSTFMVEMSEASAILHNATDRSLILLDEIGRGTSTYDGVAIAWSITEFLHDSVGAKTIFATHYHELTQLTEQLQHAVNYNVAVHEAGEEIVFQHHLVPGGADRSYGIHVARLAGLDPQVIVRARAILKILEAGHQVAGAVLPAEPDPDQLPLFDPEHPVVEELRALDPDQMTPMDALAMLVHLKQRATED